jgi:hypothetical protein
MQRKGLFEWKILAAIFAVLIVLSSAFAASTGVKDFFLNLTGNLGGLMNGSPFGSFFSSPPKATNYVEVRLFADNISLAMETPVNITAGGSSIDNFKGVIKFDFAGNSTELLPAGSDMRIAMGLKATSVNNVKLPKLVLSGIDFSVTSEKTNITAPKENLEIYDFSGEIRVTDHVLLSGNVTKVKDDTWSIG